MTGVVVLMGGLSALSLLATNPRAVNPIGALARAPASVVALALAPKSEVQKTIERTSTLDLECSLPESTMISTEVLQLRIRGRYCAGGDFAGAEITNLTNGYTATVFTPEKDAYSSDYVHLSDGQNRLRVIFLLETGERQVKEFAINRM
jgi:hypothetical protein